MEPLAWASSSPNAPPRGSIATAPLLSLRLLRRQPLGDPLPLTSAMAWRFGFLAEQSLPEFRPGDQLLLAHGTHLSERSYLIASSSLSGTDELVVHTSAMPDYLCRLPIGARIVANIRPQANFRPPDDPRRPIVMLAGGLGIGPFMGFLAERAEVPHAGSAWLIFGNSKRHGGYFYQTALNEMKASGRLLRLDTAFSADMRYGDCLPARVRQFGDAILHWLAHKNALLYICCERPALLVEIDHALEQVIDRYGTAFGLDRHTAFASWNLDGTIRRQVAI